MMEMPNKNDTIERLRDIRDRAVVSDGMFMERATYMVKLIDDVLELLEEQESYQEDNTSDWVLNGRLDRE